MNISTSSFLKSGQRATTSSPVATSSKASARALRIMLETDAIKRQLVSTVPSEVIIRRSLVDAVGKALRASRSLADAMIGKFGTKYQFIFLFLFFLTTRKTAETGFLVFA